MQHAVALSSEEDDQVTQTASFSDAESGASHPTTSEPIKLILSYTWFGIKYLFHLLHPSTIRNGYNRFRQMTFKDIIKNLFLLFIKCIRLLLIIIIYALRYIKHYYLKHGFVIRNFSLVCMLKRIARRSKSKP
jgi:hypothetical protein